MVRGLQIPQKLIKTGRNPSPHSFKILISLLLKSKSFNLILKIFAQITSNSIAVDATTHSLVARALVASRRFEDAEQFVAQCWSRFDSGSKSNLFGSLIVRACIQGGSTEKALTFLRGCVKNHGVRPSRRAIRLLVSAFCGEGDMESAMEVLETLWNEKDGNLVDNYMCSLMIGGFSRIGKPELGLELYDRATKVCKLQPNVVTATAVVDAFCRAGRVQEASEFIRKMEDGGLVPDVVVYSCWICGYIRKGALMEGMHMHKQMVVKGITPDVVNYTNFVDGLCKKGSVEKVIGFFDEMKKNGVEPNLVTYTSVIRGFCKRNKLDEAMSLFRKLDDLGIVADEVVYSIMIDGLCRKGDLDTSFALLKEMEKRRIKPGIVTMNTVIDGLCKAGRVSEADEISKDIVADNFTYSILLHAYSREMNIVGVLQIKKRLGEAGICMDVVTCNILLKALLMTGMTDDAHEFFKEISQMDVTPNDTTYCIMINGYCNLGLIDKALEIFNEYRRNLTIINGSSHNCLIKGLCKENMDDKATEIFEDLMQKNLIPHSATFRMLINTILERGGEERLLNFLSRMENIDPELFSVCLNEAIIMLCTKGCYVTAIDIYMLLRRGRLLVTSKTYYMLLKGLVHIEDRHIINIILTDCIRDYGTSDPHIINAIFISLCVKNVEKAIRFLSISDRRDFSLSAISVAIGSLKTKCGIEHAYRLLLKAADKNLVMDIFVYSLVMDGLCKAGYIEKALYLCARMKDKGVCPNIVIYNSMINGLCRQGCLTEAFRVFDSLEYHSVYPTIVTYTTLISALTREGYLQDATHLFQRMVTQGFSPNTHLYNKLISGYCNFGLVEEAMKLLSDLEGSCLEPDAFTVTAIINGFCLRGEIDGAIMFFNEYKSRGYYPDFLGFMNLVKGLFYKGRMEETRSILKDMFQCREIENLINSAGDEPKTEPLVSLLSLASEQGRIKEVILILNEVGYTTFCSWKPKPNIGSIEPRKLQVSGTSGTDRDITDEGVVQYPLVDSGGILSNSSELRNSSTDIVDVTNSLSKMDNWGNDNEDLRANSLECDFETYYSIISTLCFQGDVQKASNIAKEVVKTSAMGSRQSVITI